MSSFNCVYVDSKVVRLCMMLLVVLCDVAIQPVKSAVLKRTDGKEVVDSVSDNSIGSEIVESATRPSDFMFINCYDPRDCEKQCHDDNGYLHTFYDCVELYYYQPYSLSYSCECHFDHRTHPEDENSNELPDFNYPSKPKRYAYLPSARNHY